MEKTTEEIYEEFSVQLCEWFKSGKPVDAGNQDLKYGLTLQKERLDKFSVQMEYMLQLRGEWMDKISNAVYSDAKYTNRLVYRSYRKTVHYSLEGRKRLSTEDDEILYTIITWLNHGEIQETYCCPNCGTIHAISELMEGCPYCGTRFLITDLFPKVTNFYFLRSYSMNNKEAKSRISRWLLTGGLVGMLLNSPTAISSFIEAGQDGKGFFGRVFLMLFYFAVGGGFGALAGYAVGAVKAFLRLLRDGVRQAPMAVDQMHAKKRLGIFMGAFDPAFSFEYFIGRVQALMKILMFTDERGNLAVFEGRLEGNPFDNLIDAQFGGAIGLNHCSVKEGYFYLDLNVYMTDTYCENHKIFQKQDVFQMGLCKNSTKPVDYGFSIKKVCCKSCGASFDASKEKHCPYCKSSYALKEDDWVITYIRKQ